MLLPFKSIILLIPLILMVLATNKISANTVYITEKDLPAIQPLVDLASMLQSNTANQAISITDLKNLVRKMADEI